MKSSYINTILLVVCFIATSSTVFVDAKKRTGSLRRKITSTSSNGKGDSSSSSKGKGSYSKSYSSKSPSSKGKGGKSSKAPSSKGKGGKSSKAPSSKGKGGKSSKSPKSKGKGGQSSKAPTSSRAPSLPGPNAPSMPTGPFTPRPTAQGQPLFCAGYTEAEYNSILSSATVSKIQGQPVNVQAANFVQRERFCPPDATSLTLGALLHERYALSAFYFASGGATWRFCSEGRPCAVLNNQMRDSWLSNSHVCNWYGITCDGDKKVVDISMVPSGGIDIGLNGIIANEVYELTELVALKLEFNDSDPNKKGKLKGTISDAIKNAKNLQLFDIDQQQVGGTIPDAFYETPSLNNIDLDNNQLGGTLSGPGIAKLQNLVFFSASGNPFAQQPLPWQFGTLKTLRFLGLSDANLVGTVPPYFRQLTEMRALDLRNNNLSGSIDFLSNYASLETLNLSNNDFSGTIPSSLWTRSTLRFVNFENTLIGNNGGSAFPDLGINWDMPELQILRLANTEVSGPLPVEGLKKLSSLRILTLENTNLTGTIPVESCSDWTISISKGGNIFCPARCSCIEL